MKKKISILIGGLLAIAMLFGVLSVQTVYAQTGTPPTPVAGQPGDGHGHGRRGLGQVELAAAAKALDMTTDELSTALKDGKTLADLVTTAGVDIQDVQDAITAAHVEEMRTRIAQSVTDGTMTQEKADWLLEGLDKGYLDGPGFGFGFTDPHGKPGEQPNGKLDPTNVQPTQPANQ